MDLLKTFVDWSPYANPCDHLWEKSSKNELKCLVCDYSLRSIKNKTQICPCKPSFVDDLNSKPEEYRLKHFFIPTEKLPNICFACNKAKLSKSSSSNDLSVDKMNDSISFSAIKRVASFLTTKTPNQLSFLICIWCQRVIHDSIGCRKTVSGIENFCDLGIMSKYIIPPSWIVKNTDSESNVLKDLVITNRKHLNFTVTPPSSISDDVEPMIVFINLKSGNYQGIHLYRSFLKYLNMRQIFILPESDPLDVMKMFKNLPRMLILVCGGDGTISWISSTIDSLDMQNQCTIACIPLGTGNDLSQCLKWGHAANFSTSYPFKFLYHIKKLATATEVKIDQWAVDFSSRENQLQQFLSPNEPGYTQSPGLFKNTKFINYCSIGADAAIALDFHKNRQLNPGGTNGRMSNFLSYFSFTMKYITTQVYKKIFRDVQLFCDHEDMSEKLRKHNVQIILLLNIRSYASGMNPWHCSPIAEENTDNKTFTAQSTDDGLIEVLGLSLTSFAKVCLNLGGYKIAQCRHVKIITNDNIHVQIDGEPFIIPPSCLTVERCSQIKMLKRETIANNNNGDFSETTHQSDFEGKLNSASFQSNVGEQNTSLFDQSSSARTSTDTQPGSIFQFTPTKRIRSAYHQRSSSVGTASLYPQQYEVVNKPIYSTLPSEFLYKGEYLLFDAVKKGDDFQVLDIINSYPKLNFNVHEHEVNCESEDAHLENTLLHYAARQRNVFCISLLAINGADIHSKNAKNVTPYNIIQLQRGSKELMTYLNAIHL